MRSLVVVVVMLAAPSALAFPWMVKHNYGSCAACHVDPSGGGQLTAYGRAQADVLVRWKLNKPPPDQEQEVPKSANFLWFMEMPEWLNLSGNVRFGPMVRPASSTPVVPLFMAADLYATIAVDRFLFHGTAGFGLLSGNARTQLKDIVAPQCDPLTTGSCGAPGKLVPAFVAREFWAGAKFADEAVMVRAGRMNLPFGLRNNEHNSFVRDLTVTNINIDQQVGLNVAYNSETLRAEVMGIAGNFQLGPDAWRERGYSAFAEYAIKPNAYVGVSSLIAHSAADLTTGSATTRQAHGLFARFAPVESLALLAEVDLLAWTSPPALDRVGFASWLQGDLEVMQGLHVLASFEAANRGDPMGATQLGGWLSAAWYFGPHFEFRIDNIVRTSTATGATPDYTLLAMLHFFL
jgi:hypothetical protein